MALPLKSAEITTRFGSYIEELHKVLSVRGMRFGSPGDIAPIVERLSIPNPLRREMVSLVRSIVFRESEQITSPELMELVTLAIGGPDVDLAAPELQNPLRDLRQWVSDVRRSLWKSVPEPPAQTESAAPSQQPASPPAPVPELKSAPESLPELPPINSATPAPAPPQPAARPGNNIFFRASLMSSESERPIPLEVLGAANVPAQDATSAPESSESQEAAAPAAPLWHRFGWFIAVGVLLLGMAAGILLRWTLAHSSEGVFFVSSGIMTGNLLTAQPPVYPTLASLAHVDGEVVLQVVVAPDGTVSAVRVLQGNWLLRSAADHAVRSWHYRPYMVNGRAVDISTIVTLDFQRHH